MNEAEEIQFEKYISKQMSSEEKRAFEMRLASDEDLGQRFKEAVASHHLIKEAGRADMLNLLNSFEDDAGVSSEVNKTIPLWIKRSLPIAAILIAIFAMYQLGIFDSNQGTSKVFAANFEVYTSPSNLRTDPDTDQAEWQLAVSYYDAENYDEAFTQFDLLLSDPEIPSYLSAFYGGLSAMAMSQPNHERAIKLFDMVLESDNDYQQQAQWYKALALLQLNKELEASIILHQIVALKFFNNEKAQKILTMDWAN